MSLYLQEFSSDLNSHLHIHLYEFISVVSTDSIEAEFNTKTTDLQHLHLNVYINIDYYKSK